MAYVGLYASNGSLNVTVVSGASYTGLYAADGSMNVVADTGSTYVGLHHGCGALNVKTSPGTLVPLMSPNGSLYVTTGSTLNTGQRVTVVSGSLSGGNAGTPIGLLMALTHAS